MLESALEDVVDVGAFSIGVCMRGQSQAFNGHLSRLLYLYAFLGGARTSTTAKTKTLCVRSVALVRSMRGEVPRRHI